MVPKVLLYSYYMKYSIVYFHFNYVLPQLLTLLRKDAHKEGGGSRYPSVLGGRLPKKVGKP